ncbi:ribosomal protein S3Ae [Methanococcus vannielii SB]|jgi:small subunit ribosomal protein S3Ae|uniref:Small ribosomal subunit protein eS1 n=1 Tax=Methanococcus vannielii (strain ATCC 35089 / DSM 1224 / JCM 13029 / OCM 148 / SB) TaxID=406327 RepID=RS3A_METVS|nr:30S ribosomal protein S3ae [Methanococcus vannielii]A6USE4.1 RecName: Full=Small ribosomal subunit protein eS1; AltName: Full=30S ribosomal protein S3Ae; AltName: Full=Ribosomal protein S1e [Methanococcus vannielii SB]ABR55416.1 ribosomal protein S3Ae [Methanococcus vannielii SB]
MARMKARSAKGKRVAKDTWKSKVWYNIYTPQSFGGDVIGQTPANDPSALMGRISEISLRDLTNEHSKHMTRMYFKVDGVSGNNAITQFVGHDTTREYLKSQIRRRRSKINVIIDVRTKDGFKVRVKALVLTAVRARDYHKTEIRVKMEQIIKEMANETAFAEFVHAMVMGGVGSKIYSECKKMFPLKRVEIFKSEVLEFGKAVLEVTPEAQEAVEGEEKQ